ncbi:MAG: hypothetical protein ABI629_19200 [bacterium]
MSRRIAVLCATAVLLGGCGTLTANNTELLKARQQLASGNADAALAEVAVDERDDLPAILDRAMILQAQGKPVESNAEFDRAIQCVHDYEARAVLSATAAGTGAGSLMLNDKVLEYQGDGFEKVLMHGFKARNYLMLGDPESARVEIRNANMRQDEERKKNQEAIDEAKKEGEGKYAPSEIDKQFGASQAALSRLDNVYQNPFATYLSGVVYEVNGEPGDAFIDYKQAYEMVPNPLVGADLTRLAKQLGREDELPAGGVGAVADGAAPGNVLVFLDNGLAPERVQIKFPLPGPGTVLFAAVPMTQPVSTNVTEADVVGANGEVLGHTQMLVDVEAMSVRSLHDHYPGILTRQAIRLATRAAAGAVAQQQLGAAGLLLTTTFNAIAEQADLRAWYTLPRSVHVARINLPADQQQLTLRLLDGSGSTVREVAVPVISPAGASLRVASLRYVDGQVIAAGQPPLQIGALP